MCSAQVQDVGLIFLSAMASSIALLCKEDGYEPREALGTSLLTLAIATFIVGILIVLVGSAQTPACWEQNIAVHSDQHAARVCTTLHRDFLSPSADKQHSLYRVPCL